MSRELARARIDFRASFSGVLQPCNIIVHSRAKPFFVIIGAMLKRFLHTCWAHYWLHFGPSCPSWKGQSKSSSSSLSLSRIRFVDCFGASILASVSARYVMLSSIHFTVMMTSKIDAQQKSQNRFRLRSSHDKTDLRCHFRRGQHGANMNQQFP